ncbi:RNB-domain-containing protein [Backusella circina FSU 941]|nr:RNB-domain-containing protein [Backusella circina FSU 941]
MLKGDRDKVIDALSSTLSAIDMKHIKVDGNLIQFVPKGPKFSVDKIPLNEPDFQESDEWKTTLDKIQYFLKKVMDEKQQERENDDDKEQVDPSKEVNSKDETIITAEKPKKQRKRRSKKAVDQEEGGDDDDQQVVPQQSNQGAAAGKNKKNNNKKRTKKTAVGANEEVEPVVPKGVSRRKRTNKKSEQQVPDQEDPAAVNRSLTESSSSVENTTAAVDENKSNSSSTPAKAAQKKKRSKKANQQEPKVDETPVVADGREESVAVPKRKTKRVLNKVDHDRKTQILESDVFDYSELEDVLTTPSLPKRENLPFFAPDKKVSKDDRISNKNKPSQKNKHAEIPPPKSLTTHKPVVAKPKKRKLKLSPTEVLIKSLRTDLSLDTATANSTDVTHKLDQLLLNTKNKKYFDELDMIVSKGGRRIFPGYLKADLIPYLVEQKILLQGYIHISRRNGREAWVVVDESETDAFVYGTLNRNRAMDGDRVVIIPVDSEKVWNKKLADGANRAEENRRKRATLSPPKESKEDEEEVVVDEDEEDDSYEDIDDDEDEEVEEIKEVVTGSNGGAKEEEDVKQEDEEVEVAAPPALCGRVVYIYPSTEKKEYPGTLVSTRNGMPMGKELSNLPGVVWFKPINKRVPMIMLKSPLVVSFFERKKLNPADNNILKAKTQYWSPNFDTPLGTLSGYVGQEDTLPTQCKSILLDSNITSETFSPKVISSIQDSPRDKSSSRRKDFRSKRIFTIDPATAKDLDDALHVEKISDDEFEVGVHIADVSHFVDSSSPLDTSAFHRATSVYLCDRVIPMFPFQLSEEKCSLNPNEDRMTFSVIWRIDNEGNVKSTEFTESTIRSCAKLAYDDAQSVIETDKLPKDLVLEEGVDREGVEKDIKYLATLARKMRQRRFDTGSLSINSISLSFQLDEEGKPIGVSIYQQKEANKVIEEFMLLANMSVAHKLHQVYPEEALLRQHGPPKEKALNKFLKIAESLGYPLDGSSAGSLQASLNAITSEHVKQVLEILAAKPMQRAKYFCAASSGYSREKVEKVAHQCNDKKESAKNVEDDTKRVYLAYYLDMLERKQEKPIKCKAIVTSLDKEAIEVLVPDYGIEKRIFMDALPLSRFVYNPKNFTLNAYWKANIEVNLEWEEQRKATPLEGLPTGAELYKSSVPVTPELLAEQNIDKNTRMQRFSVLGEIEVRLQTDLERSPPATFVFPVNPF